MFPEKFKNVLEDTAENPPGNERNNVFHSKRYKWTRRKVIYMNKTQFYLDDKSK